MNITLVSRRIGHHRRTERSERVWCQQRDRGPCVFPMGKTVGNGASPGHAAAPGSFALRSRERRADGSGGSAGYGDWWNKEMGRGLWGVAPLIFFRRLQSLDAAASTRAGDVAPPTRDGRPGADGAALRRSVIHRSTGGADRPAAQARGREAGGRVPARIARRGPPTRRVNCVGGVHGLAGEVNDRRRDGPRRGARVPSAAARVPLRTIALRRVRGHLPGGATDDGEAR